MTAFGVGYKSPLDTNNNNKAQLWYQMLSTKYFGKLLVRKHKAQSLE